MKSPKVLLWILLGLLGVLATLVIALVLINMKQGRPGDKSEKPAAKKPEPQLTPGEDAGGRETKAVPVGPAVPADATKASGSKAGGSAGVAGKAGPTPPAKADVGPAVPTEDSPKGQTIPPVGSNTQPKSAGPSRGGNGPLRTGDPQLDFGIPGGDEPDNAK